MLKQGESKNIIAVFARAPVAGEVKTRLAKTLGDQAARDIYTAMLRDVLANAHGAASQMESARVVVFYTPQDAFTRRDDSLREFWSGAHSSQSDGDLGARLGACFSQLREYGAQKIIVIGSDAPDLPTSVLQVAFRVLDDNDFVFVPAEDGGFILLGLSVLVNKNLFRDVRWSSENTLVDVLANIGARRVRLLETWRDVDHIEDLRALHRRLKNAESIAPHSYRVLDMLSSV